MVSKYKNNIKNPYIFIEVKRQGSGILTCLEQLKSYISTSPTCRYGIATDGVELLFINKELEVIAIDTQFIQRPQGNVIAFIY